MADLDKSKQAHVAVFMFLYINNQSIRPFASTADTKGMGDQKVSELTFYNAASSADMLKTLATQIAHMLIVYINQYYTHQREKDYADKPVSDLVAKLATLLATPDKTVSDLADAVDEIFRFENESTSSVPVAAMAEHISLSAGAKKKLQKLGIA
jgi:hypothetical protein